MNNKRIRIITVRKKRKKVQEKIIVKITEIF